jgi:hypothetical protein
MLQLKSSAARYYHLARECMEAARSSLLGFIAGLLLVLAWQYL